MANCKVNFLTEMSESGGQNMQIFRRQRYQQLIQANLNPCITFPFLILTD